MDENQQNENADKINESETEEVDAIATKDVSADDCENLEGDKEAVSPSRDEAAGPSREEAAAAMEVDSGLVLQENEDVEMPSLDESNDKNNKTSEEDVVDKPANETNPEVEAEEPGESADICLIPDNDAEPTGAEKEKAIRARQNAEKEEEEKSSTEGKDDGLEESTTEAGADDSTIEPTNEEEKTIISFVIRSEKDCLECAKNKSCEYRFRENTTTNNYDYICDKICLDTFVDANKDKYYVRRKKYIVEDLAKPIEESCILCKEKKLCKYNFKQDDDELYICNDDCFNLLSKEEPDKLSLKRMSIRVKNLGSTLQTESEPKIVARSAQEAESAKLDRDASFVRRCCTCNQAINMSLENLHWQTLDFCNQLCLGKYQNTIGDKCRTCYGSVSHQSLGKYCVRFGFEICQFCCAGCLDKYKKSLKNCANCQKDISNSNDGFLAPVGDNEQFKDFCSQYCLKNYDGIINPSKRLKVEICAVCNNKKQAEVEIILDGREHYFCSNPCFSAFKFVNNIVPDQCGTCSKNFERKSSESFTIYSETEPQVFCGQICMNMFISQNRKIVFCQWCKVKKYNFDMIEKSTNLNETITMCSLNCLVLYGVSLNAISKQTMKCDNCYQDKTPQYHLTMSDSSIRNFCTYQCVMQFQSQFSRAPLTLSGEHHEAPFPTGLPKRVKANQSQVQTVTMPLRINQTSQQEQLEQQLPQLPIIASVDSLAGDLRRAKANRSRKKTEAVSPINPLQANRQAGRVYTAQLLQPSLIVTTPDESIAPLVVPMSTTGTMTTENLLKTNIIEVPALPKTVTNKQTMCKPQTNTKGVMCKPLSFNSGIQTDEDVTSKIFLPVPVPVYVPQPMCMYTSLFPMPVPVPLPIPVPIFIPTTRNSANGIMKEIKKIQDKMPSDPFEAELLMMAEMVAGDKKKEDSDSEDEDEIVQDVYNNEEIVDTNNSYGDDVLQMALKMATEYDEPAVDLESAMTANTITQPPPGQEEDESALIYQTMQMHERPARGRKRTIGNAVGPTTRNNNRMGATVASQNKRQRRNDGQDINVTPTSAPPSQIIATEKPDANMCLKYTFGVNAWKQWVMTKNADLEKSAVRRKPFKSELLQMTADELNYSLCLFVKEVRKPNGTEYAPDTIYYLVLGIQQYLYESGRIDNIFTDSYYERFTDCLDEVARKFSVLYNDSQYIVTRVEEEHLWECKQLGAHSPHVLLSTLMFFNTKHFNLTSVEEHMQLSFSHIMKHWKRNAQGAKTPGARNILLRFYPPQTGADSRKKKVYEQQENEANPLRCPVRLYEFYLSKCPESVKTRNDVFYLQPERSCVPDSPVWYSTQALNQDSLQKMLHRVKMVKEINVALLTA